MQFSDTTNFTGLIQDCEFNLGLGDTGISGNAGYLKHFTRLINNWNHKATTMILMANDTWDYDDSNQTNLPILTTSLVANQQDYQLPSRTLRIKRAEITYDGTNWKKLTALDARQPSDAVTSSSGNYSQDEPYYDLQANSLFLFPTPASNVSSGLKLWVAREPDEFTTADTTQEPGFDEPFHRILSLGASLDWAIVKKLPNTDWLASQVKDYEERLRKFYGTKQQDKVSRLTPNKEDNR